MSKLGNAAVCLGVTICLLAVVCVSPFPAAATDAPTFSREVVRIFQQQCQTCHHPGDIAPFSLMDYKSAAPYAPLIKQRVASRTMPPWKPEPGIGDFQDARILTPEQIDTIVKWADAGAPEGDPADLPAALSFPDGWALGQPDLVLTIPGYSPPAGSDVYRCFSLPTGLAEDRYVSAVQLRPGNRGIVHHVLLFADPNGVSKALDEKDAEPGYTCFGGPGFTPDDSFYGGWAPGIRPMQFPPGMGMQVHAGSRVAVQAHYHPRQAGETDQTMVGIYFSRSPIDKIVRVLPLANTDFRIPAGDPNYAVNASFTIPSFFNVHAVNIAPHMHLLGRDMEAAATLPDQTQRPLIRIADWDFEWQGIYTYRQPVALPGGTKVGFTAHYDNSANNPRNPNSPPKEVGWGEATTDEMALVFVGFTFDAEHLAPPQVPSAGLVNAASFAGGTGAPGMILSLFGSGLGSSWEAAAALPLPKSLSRGMKVLVNGTEAPLFYASPAQINFQMPFEAEGSSATVTVVRSEDGATQSVSLPLGAARPGIFTLTSDGTGPAAAVHVDGSLVGATLPAVAGEWLLLYATGLGKVSPVVASGSAPAGLSTTLAPVTVSVGDKTIAAGWAGLAPGYAGLYQINFQVPTGAPSGAEVPLKISIAGVESNAVKLAVK